MPIMAPFASLPKYLDPFMVPLAGRVPPLALLDHRGRRSGRHYTTPVQAYATSASGFIVALVYERDADWALNLLAAGGGEMTRGGRRYAITNVHRSGRQARDRLPAWAAPAMRLLAIQDFIEFDAAPIPG